MTKKEILDAISNKVLQSKGMYCDGDIPEQILSPWYLMDIAYQIYCKDIAPAHLKHEAKKYRNKFASAYTTFNKCLYKLLTPDEYDVIIDRMDECATYLHNYVIICKVDLLNACQGYDDASRNLIASTLLCRFIVQLTHELWKGIYKTSSHKEEVNTHLSFMVNCLYKIAINYEKDLHIDNVVDPNKCSKLNVDCKVLAQKLLDYIKTAI